MHFRTISITNICISMASTVPVFVSSYDSVPKYYPNSTLARRVILELKGDSSHAVLYCNTQNLGAEVLTMADDSIYDTNIYRIVLIFAREMTNSSRQLSIESSQPTFVNSHQLTEERRSLFAPYNRPGIYI
jgi:hypothetical protein